MPRHARQIEMEQHFEFAVPELSAGRTLLAEPGKNRPCFDPGSSWQDGQASIVALGAHHLPWPLVGNQQVSRADVGPARRIESFKNPRCSQQTSRQEVRWTTPINSPRVSTLREIFVRNTLTRLRTGKGSAGLPQAGRASAIDLIFFQERLQASDTISTSLPQSRAIGWSAFAAWAAPG